MALKGVNDVIRLNRCSSLIAISTPLYVDKLIRADETRENVKLYYSAVQIVRVRGSGCTLVPEKSVQYVAQFLASADLNCACARFCYSVSPWVTFQKF